LTPFLVSMLVILSSIHKDNGMKGNKPKAKSGEWLSYP
jgi:hypothetical protein